MPSADNVPSVSEDRPKLVKAKTCTFIGEAEDASIAGFARASEVSVQSEQRGWERMQSIESIERSKAPRASDGRKHSTKSRRRSTGDETRKEPSQTKSRRRSTGRKKSTLRTVEIPVALLKGKGGARCSTFVSAMMARKIQEARAEVQDKNWQESEGWQFTRLAESEGSEESDDGSYWADGSSSSDDPVEEFYHTVTNEDIGFGHTMDFMHRVWVKLPKTFFSRCLSSCIKCITHTDNSRSNSTLSIEEAKKKFPIFSDLIDLACTDMAAGLLMEDVIIGWKKRGDASWGSCDSHMLIDRFKQMVAHKKQIAALRVEVRNYCSRLKSYSGGRIVYADPAPPETAEEKHARLQVFWKQLHVGGRKSDSLSLEAPAEVVPLVRSSSKSTTKVSKSTLDRRSRKSIWKLRPARTHSAGEDCMGGAVSSPVKGAGLMKMTQDYLQRAQELPDISTLSPISGSPDVMFEIPSKLTGAPRAAQAALSHFHQFSGSPTVKFDVSDSQLAGLGMASGSPSKSVSSSDRKERCSTMSWAYVRSEDRASVSSQWEDKRASVSIQSQAEVPQKLTGFDKALAAARHQNKANYERSCGIYDSPIIYNSRAAKQLGERRLQLTAECCPRFLKEKSSSMPSLSTDSRSRPWSGASVRRRTAAFTFEEHNQVTDDSAKPEALKADSLFTAPWHSNGGSTVWRAGTAPGKYLRTCQTQGSIPKTLPFLTGDSKKMQAAGMGLTDHHLSVISSMLVGLRVGEVDLADNAQLSDKAIATFLRILQDKSEAASALKQLSLKRCTQVAAASMDVVLRMLTCPSSHLRRLDVSGMVLGTKRHTSFCEAVHSHPHLRELLIADTGMSAMCVGDIFYSSSLEEVDLSWNCFTADVFSVIGERVAENQHVRVFALSNCSSDMLQEGKQTVTPIVAFIEYLAKDKELRSLDLSMNRLDFRGVQVIEDALQVHKHLAQLDLSNNPLGVLGMRSLLRLLARRRSGLRHFFCEGCKNGITCRESAFNMTCPDGRYSLDLSWPHHRAVLRMLYKTCVRLAIAPADAFLGLSYNAPPYAHPTKDSAGLFQVACRGRLCFIFHTDPGMEVAFQGIGEHAFGTLMERWLERTRIQPVFKKAISLCAHWKSLEGRFEDQEVFLRAMSKDFLLTYPQVSELSTSHDVAVRAANTQGTFYEDERNTHSIHVALLGSVSGGPFARYLVYLLSPSLSEYMKTAKQSSSLWHFNVDNPTGHYSLRLDNACEFAVAQQLCVLDRWESIVNKRAGRFDTSQYGNYSQFRNMLYDDHGLGVASVADWYLPEQGLFQFDYVSLTRTKQGAPEVDKFTFMNMLLVLGQSQSTGNGQVHALRQVAHYINLRSTQLREMLGIFSSEEACMEVLVVLFLRLTDIWNEKVFRARIEDPKVLLALQRRLGYATFFPFIQPEHFSFEFDFSQYDQRLAAHLLCVLSVREGDQHIKEYSLIHSDGMADPMPLGVPRSWELFAKCPTEGIFRGHYTCAPEERRFNFRKDLLAKYGNWTSDITEKEIMWWAGLSEAPEDVISYLEFLMSRFRNVSAAYDAMLKGKTKTAINLRDFEDFIKKKGCKRFEGQHEQERIKAVFRYLDASGNGDTSRGEWTVLDMLWKEIKLSMNEFGQFLHRTFHGNLSLAWEFFDEDGSGEIEIDEFCEAVLKVKYFGPVKETYRQIDADEQGTISFEEFEAMWEKFDPNHDD